MLTAAMQVATAGQRDQQLKLPPIKTLNFHRGGHDEDGEETTLNSGLEQGQQLMYQQHTQPNPPVVDAFSPHSTSHSHSHSLPHPHHTATSYATYPLKRSRTASDAQSRRGEQHQKSPELQHQHQQQQYYNPMQPMQLHQQQPQQYAYSSYSSSFPPQQPYFDQTAPIQHSYHQSPVIHYPHSQTHHSPTSYTVYSPPSTSPRQSQNSYPPTDSASTHTPVSAASYAASPPTIPPQSPAISHTATDHHYDSWSASSPSQHASHYQHVSEPPAPSSSSIPPPSESHGTSSNGQQQQQQTGGLIHGSTVTETPLLTSAVLEPSVATDTQKAKRGMVTTIIEHCNAIYTFASRYASLSTAHPTPNAGYQTDSESFTVSNRNRHPPAPEIQEMAQRARLVLDLVERIKKDKDSPELIQGVVNTLSSNVDQSRKRGWDESNQSPREAGKQNVDSRTQRPAALSDASQGVSSSSFGYDEAGFRDPEARSLAERDMMTIRSKRSAAAAVAAANATADASMAGTSNPGLTSPGNTVVVEKLGKKGRKRGRTPLPGKCHSCNIRETPEWRRGPDGARTLCNACGLHYAKLVRKRDKALTTSASGGNDVDAMPIDMEMVRASSQRGSGFGIPMSSSFDSAHESPHPTFMSPAIPTPSSAEQTPKEQHAMVQESNPYSGSHSFFSAAPQHSQSLSDSALPDPAQPWNSSEVSMSGSGEVSHQRVNTSDERGGGSPLL